MGLPHSEPHLCCRKAVVALHSLDWLGTMRRGAETQNYDAARGVSRVGGVHPRSWGVRETERRRAGPEARGSRCCSGVSVEGARNAVCGTVQLGLSCPAQGLEVLFQLLWRAMNR